MQPLNPFLSAFSKSSALLAQCQPPQHHVLLVPTADVLLNSRDPDSGAPLVASIVENDFLASHILRIVPPKGGGQQQAGGGGGGKDDAAAAQGGQQQNLREMRGKPRLYATINGRSLVIKDSMVFTNKGTTPCVYAAYMF